VPCFGASGAVGTFAVQIAKAVGGEVTGVCSKTKAEVVWSLGADHGLDVAQDHFADGAVATTSFWMSAGLPAVEAMACTHPEGDLPGSPTPCPAARAGATVDDRHR
jgi:D-arabinose 1-dehydrogenase-like Zn-dependent alcohol dehydrogenase